MAAKIGTAFIDVQPDLTSLQAQTSAFFASSRWKGTAAKAAVGLGAITVAATAAGKALFDVGQEFDDAYDTIRSRTDATGKEMRKLKTTFRDVVGTTPTDFDTAAKAVAGLRQHLDITGRPLTRITKQLTSLSKITGEDIDRTVTAATRLFGDWSVRTKDQSERLDEMFRLTRLTGIGINDLMELMVQFGSPLRQLGFSFEEAAVMFSRFEREGVNMETLLPGLRFALKNLSVPTEDLAKLMKQMGVEGGDAKEKLESVFDLISSSRVKAADKTLLASQVFGGRAWADMKAAIEEGRFEFDQLLRKMEGGDSTIRGTEQATRDLTEHWQVFANNLKLFVEPIARDVFEGLSDLMRDVTKAFQREGFEGVIDVLVRRLEEAMPKIVEAGKDIAGALVRGFLNAPVLLQLAAGGWLATKLGGKIGGIGATLGTRFGTSFGNAAGPIAVGIIGSALAGIAVGSKLKLNIESGEIEILARRYEMTEAAVRRVAKFIEKNPDLGFAEAAQIIGQKTDQIEDSIEDMEVTSGRSLAEILRDSRKTMGDIREVFGKESQRAKNKFAENIGATVVAIKDGMADGEIATKEGNQKIRELLARQLKLYGVKPRDVYGDHPVSTSDSQLGPGHNTGAQTGLMVPGTGSGDKVPAMLEPGEVVINREAVRRMGGARRVNRINKLIPRFAKGGVVTGDTDYGAALGRALTAMASRTGRSIFVQSGGRTIAEQAALFAQYGPGRAAAPSPTAPHVRGIAADITPGQEVFGGVAGRYGLGFPVPGEPWHIQLMKAVSGLAAAVRIRLPRFTANYAMAGPGAGGLNKMAAALERVMGRRVSGLAGAGDATGPAPGHGRFSKSQLISLWNQTGQSGDANLMAAIALAESGGDPGAINDIPGNADPTGLWQIRPSPVHAVAQQALLNPTTNAQWAHTIFGTEGLRAWEVYTNNSHVKFLQRGGIAHLAKGGDAVSGPGGGTGQKFGRGGIVGMQGGGDTEGIQWGNIKIPHKGQIAPNMIEKAKRILDRLKKDGPDEDEVKAWNKLPDKVHLFFLEHLRKIIKPPAKLFEDGSIKLPPELPDPKIDIGKAKFIGPLFEKIKFLKGETERLAKVILDYEAAHAAPGSAPAPGETSGEGLSAHERLVQLVTNKTLLGHMEAYAPALRKAIARVGKRSKRGVIFQGLLDTLVGPTTTAGTMLEVRNRIWELEHPETPTSERDAERAANLQAMLDTANRENAILTAQIPIFSSVFQKAPFGGVFHEGGVVPGPLGSSRTIVAQSGETITPAGAAPVEVTLVVNDGAVNPNAIDVRINDRLAQVARSATTAGGVTGRKASYRG